MAKKSKIEPTAALAKNVSKQVDRFEAGLGKIEDELGLVRSAATDPWANRLRRIREAAKRRA
jgi:hypothetical protein